MNALCYGLARVTVRFVGGLSVHHRVLHGERLRRDGPFVLACTHVGHLEPALLSAFVRRPIYWVARQEFFGHPAAAWTLGKLGAESVNRRGVPVRAVRRSIERLRAGGIVGIFPEGGRTYGREQVIHGGPLRGGAALLAMRARVPVVPVVMLGVDRLHAVTPWLPGRRTRIRTIVGLPIQPAAASRNTRRLTRHAMTEQLRRAFVGLHEELIGTDGRA